MSVEWAHTSYSGHPGTGFEANAILRPSESQVWKYKNSKFILRGVLSTCVRQGAEWRDLTTTFLEIEYYVFRGNPGYPPDKCFGAKGSSAKIMRFPEDPSFRKLKSANIGIKRTFELEDPQVLPSSGPLGDHSEILYQICHEINNDKTKDITIASKAVDFSMFREELDPPPQIRTASQRVVATGNAPTVELYIDYATSFAPGRSVFLRAQFARTGHQVTDAPTAGIAGWSMILLEKSQRLVEGAEAISSTTEIISFNWSRVTRGNKITLSPGRNDVELAPKIQNSRFPKDIQPSFEMGQASRSYKLKIRIRMKVNEETQYIEFDCGAAIVYPADFAPLVFAKLEDKKDDFFHCSITPNTMSRVKKEFGIE